MTRYGLRALALAWTLSLAAVEAAPTPDPSFGGGTGMVIGPASTYPPTGFVYALEGLVIDRLDRPVLLYAHDLGVHVPFIGGLTSGVTRLKENGEADTAFAAPFGFRPLSGFDTGHAPYSALARDASNRIIAADGYGTISVALMRLSEDGVDDTSFGAATIGPDGVLAHRYPYAFLYPENPLPVMDIGTFLDGRVVVAMGTHQPGTADWMRRITLYRLAPVDGALDPTFGAGGVVYTSVPGGIGYDYATGIAVQPDGKMVVVARSYRPAGDYDAVVLRYNMDGTLDPTFGIAGMTVLSAGAELLYARRAAIHSDATITVAGTVYDAAGNNGRAALFRLRSNGTVDAGIGPGGLSIVSLGATTGAIYDVARRRDGKTVSVGLRIKLPGGSNTAVALSYNGGTLDPAFSGDGRYELTDPGFSESAAISVAIDSRDRIVISGTLGRGAGSRWFVARLLP